MAPFKPYFGNKFITGRVLLARELPATVKDSRTFYSDYCFIDYFCEPKREDVTYVFKLVDFEARVMKHTADPADSCKHWKYDKSFATWIIERGSESIVTILADETLLPVQVRSAYAVFELYCKREILTRSNLLVPNAMNWAVIQDARDSKVPSLRTAGFKLRNPNL